jgi:predicted NAD/FAD-binding protein
MVKMHREPVNTATSEERPSVAVIGSGVSGLTAAYLLRHTHRVTLWESEDRLGGHAHTHHLHDGDGGTVAVDSGFIVHNDRTYPLLRRLFADLDVPVRRTEMSMSIRHEATGLEYAGGRGLPGLAARPRQLLSPPFLGLLAQIRRFLRIA